MRREIINRQCQECGGYEMDDGTSEVCDCNLDFCPICGSEDEFCEEDCPAYEDGYE